LSFHLLGRLEAYSDGVKVDLGPRKQRAVLALLLLNANRVVSMERLIDDLWGDFPPTTARAALQVYVAGLRKALGTDGATLRTRAPGYVLEVEEGSLDLDRFVQLCADAHESPDSERRAALLHEALELWRDEPLPELRAEPFSSAAVAQLEQLRLRALEERIDADLALGRDAELVTELEALVAEHPYREGLRAQLMLTLYRSGRQAGALDVYQSGRRALQDDLGLEPGKELRDLEAAILRQDEALSFARSVPAEPEPEPEQPPSAGRLSRRAVIAACIAGFAAVALGRGLAALRSGSGSAAQIEPGSVGVIDPVTRGVVADVPVGFASPLIAAGEGSVWVVDPIGSTLTRIDPETNAVVTPQRGIPANGIPVSLAVGEGSVWIALNEGRVLSVLEVGPELGDLRRRIPLDTRVVGAFSLVGASVELAVGAGAVWALERARGQLTRIDPDTGRRRPLADGLGASSSIAVDGDAVWLGGPEGVRKLDARTGLELGSALVGRVPESTRSSIAVGREAVWFVGESSARLWSIDPRSVSTVGSEPIVASPSAVAVDADGAVWVASGAAASLSRLEPSTNAVETLETGVTAHGLVAGFGRIWTSPGAAPG
jgi:DNA-binding SARP family transcriptional activator/streptogramin lyase